MKKLISILSSVFILSAAIVLFLMSGVRDLRLAGNTYYVAATGSDANPGTVSSPFQTIQRCASVAHAGDTCLIRAGTYRETVTPNSGITIAPFNNESVTVSGADVVTGWQSHSGPIYKSSGLTWDMGVNRNQVFVDGQMMILARWPNTSLDVSHPEWAEADGGRRRTETAWTSPGLLMTRSWINRTDFGTGPWFRIWQMKDTPSPERLLPLHGDAWNSAVFMATRAGGHSERHALFPGQQTRGA